MFKRLRVSPAMLVAIVALIAAVGGTAIAASPVVTAAKKKKHKDAKDDTKLFKKLLKNATSAPKLVVAVAANAASATNAQHAVSADTATSAGSLGGVKVVKFHGQVPTGVTDQTIATAGPLTLLGSCDGSSNPTLKFKATEDVNHLDSDADGSRGGNAQLAAGNTDDMSGTPNFGAQGETQGITYASKTVFKINWFLRDGPNSLGTGSGCLASGFIIIG
ncbi:MAG: hypothetical protein QOD53_1904 [Thermoleophilaceae bacterium]|jgi:hypothetical protein|nr:hypothetical protein [Thermoleophilaceae bacterium]